MGRGLTKKRALVVTTVASTLDQFCMNDIRILRKSYSVSVAANFDSGNNTPMERIQEFKSELQLNDIIYKNISLNRSPLRPQNISAYKRIRNLIEENNFDLIHCHTPVAAMLVRLAARRARKKGTRIIYTAHGFHFYNGAPLKNWILYYPVERFLSRHTDVLITINKEDFSRAGKSFKTNKIEYLPGVGLDLNRFQTKFDTQTKRRELGLNDNAFVVLSVGELNKNKNHEVIIQALNRLNNANIHYVICGKGPLEDYLRKTIKDLRLEGQIHLLGFRKDVIEICMSSDLFVFPSRREGLSVALMEAMASGLPVVSSDIRGNRDLIIDGQGGYLVKPTSIEGYADAIGRLYESEALRCDFKKYNLEVISTYSVENVERELSRIYNTAHMKD